MASNLWHQMDLIWDEKMALNQCCIQNLDTLNDGIEYISLIKNKLILHMKLD